MAIGRRNKPKQQPLWIATSDLAPRSGHPFFYTRLNRPLEDDGFDTWLEKECATYFSSCGRPSNPPGVYFQMLFVGYLEGFQSERSIAWHCADRIRCGNFLGIICTKEPPTIPVSRSGGSACLWNFIARFFSGYFPWCIGMA